jgi:hypothetical protein
MAESTTNTGGLMATLKTYGPTLGVAAVAIAVIISVMWYFWGNKTMPKTSGFSDASGHEGFFGGVAVGSGDPDCLRSSSEAAQLYSTFRSRTSTTSEGPEDLSELRLLLSKMACFKKDLLGTAQQIEATRYQAYATSMDIEPIAETTARCFAKTIPKRDLDIILEKWSTRAQTLIVRLCTSMNFTEAEHRQAESLLNALVKDISDVARSVCLAGTPTIGGKPVGRELSGLESASLQEQGTYKGYY